MDYLKQLLEAQEKIKELENKVQNLQLQNQSLTRMLFGAKRERTPIADEIVDGIQYSLFAEQELKEIEMDKSVDKEIEETTENDIVHTKKTKNRRGGIRRSFLDNIELVKEEFVIKDGTVCPECSSELKPVGKKVVREEIEYVPAKLRIRAYIKMIYKCTKCGEKDSQKECVHACKKSSAIKKSKPSKNKVIFTGNNQRFPCFFRIDEIAFVQ